MAIFSSAVHLRKVILAMFTLKRVSSSAYESCPLMGGVHLQKVSISEGSTVTGRVLNVCTLLT